MCGVLQYATRVIRSTTRRITSARKQAKCVVRGTGSHRRLYRQLDALNIALDTGTSTLDTSLQV
jgi:hypothetical protein